MNNLNEYGLQTLSENEMRETNGGILPLVIVGAAILLASCSCDNNITGPDYENLPAE